MEKEKELDIYSAPIAAKYPKVPPEFIRAWLAGLLSQLTNIPAEEKIEDIKAYYEEIEPNFTYSVSTPALEGDNPRQVFEGRYEVGDYSEIEKAETAAQILYFLGRAARIDLGETSE